MKLVWALGRSQVAVSVADAKLGARIEAAVREALGAARIATAERAASTSDVAVVRLRTRRRFDALGPARLAGAIAIMRVTERGARRLPALVEDVREAGAAGVQLVWDGESPARERVEQHVFAVLERARATPKGPPVVLARTDAPAQALRVLVSRRRDQHG